MTAQVLQVHPADNVLVALQDFPQGSNLEFNGQSIHLSEGVLAKHKIATVDLRPGDRLTMYGITVGEATREISCGMRITTARVRHAVETPERQQSSSPWQAPDVSALREQEFMGYRRSDGRVGTRNYWIVVPLVFCENRNIRIMQQAMAEELGYGKSSQYRHLVRQLLRERDAGKQDSGDSPIVMEAGSSSLRPFPQIDGIKFLTHVEGCGGAYQDAQNLAGLLAGYITHPNVAGATVLSLGCQKTQIELLEREISRRDPDFSKPLLIFEQQQEKTEQRLLESAITGTFTGLTKANECQREPATLADLCIGLECGGSDGFSGLSANPAIGHAADLLVASGGSAILSEFPELAGCESELASRCVDDSMAERFLNSMAQYQQRLQQDGNDFDTNPSPGNVRDGLITDAMKSAGAARKGGTSPVVDVLDYPQSVSQSGLSLLRTPGGDVESVTAMVGSGANLVFFSTGLGTPTGNPIAPVVKIASNSQLATQMPDIIDVDAGPVIEGAKSIEDIGMELLAFATKVAGGTVLTKAEILGQDDFIPWRQCLSY